MRPTSSIAPWTKRLTPVDSPRQAADVGVLMVDETSPRRGRRTITALLNGETGQVLAIVKTATPVLWPAVALSRRGVGPSASRPATRQSGRGTPTAEW